MKRPLNSTAELLHCLLFLKKSDGVEPELVLLLEKATRASVAAGAQQLGIGSTFAYGKQANRKVAAVAIAEKHQDWRSEAVDLLVGCCSNLLRHEGGKLELPNRLLRPHYSEVPEIELAATLARALHLTQEKPDDDTMIAAGYYILKGWGEFFTSEDYDPIRAAVFECLNRSAAGQDEPGRWIEQIRQAALIVTDEEVV